MKQLLGWNRGCAWPKYFVWWRQSIARLYDFIGIAFFGHVILRRHNCLVSMLEVLLFLCQYQTFVLNLSDMNIHAKIKEITLINILGSIPHQKIYFFHLPTRGWVGINLGDAWYVDVSIIFYCSMLLYIHLGCFICIYMLFYMIFGTNLLT